MAGRAFAAAILIACMVITSRETSAHASNATLANTDPDNGFLEAMTGDWSMEGITLGKPTHYALHSEHVLAGGFVRLQMRDKAVPSQYQADFYLGFDQKKNDFIGHWLDQFGAAGARVVGEGQRDGNTLVLLFPYAEGTLRVTFTYDPGKRTWDWLLESHQKDGTWSTFAKYHLTKS